MRIDPPPSLAWANGTMPAATAAADPPLEPPGVRDVSHGLRVGPPGQRFGCGHTAEFRAVRAASDDKAGATVASDERGVDGRDGVRVLQRNVAVGDALTRIGGEEILEQERYATKWT